MQNDSVQIQSREVEVLVESSGLIPQPMLFDSVDALKAYVVAELVEQGPESFLYTTVEGAGDLDETLERLEAMEPQQQAEALVALYIEGCIFNDSGDEFRWFTCGIQS